MHRYKVRPGYGSDKLLIEFNYDPTEKLHADLNAVLKGAGLIHHSIKDYFMIPRYKTPTGPFELDHDEWDFIWIHAEENQDAIHYIDQLLQRSGLFQKEEVDFKQYEKIDEKVE